MPSATFSYLFCLSLLLKYAVVTAQQYYVATDLTPENLFTNNAEGPKYLSGILYVVNYQHDGTIGAVKPDGSVELFVTLPAGSIANAIQADKDGNLLLADFTGHNILIIDRSTKRVQVYCHNDRFNQPNDLCINSRGQIFASDPDWKNNTGQLWRIDADQSVHLLAANMGTTNGIALSPDEKILYVNESNQRTVWQFNLDANGRVSGKKLFASFPDYGLDGMKCDLKGNLYITRYGKGTVVILSREGKFVREVMMRGKKISNIAFGGDDNQTCYVTLQDRGCVEIFRSEIAGR